MSRISLVVAVSRNGVIGRDGTLPWHISSDLKRFKAITMGKPVIMGRKTWESLPRRPLPGRENIVVTRDASFRCEGAQLAKSLEEAIEIASAKQPQEICIIGGGQIYAAIFDRADRLYLSEVDVFVEGDTRFPAIDPGIWREVSREDVPKGENDTAAFSFLILDRISI